MSCHKNRMTTRNNSLAPICNNVSAMRFLFEIMFILKAMKCHFKGSYDKQDLTQLSFHMKLMKLANGSFHKFHMT